MPNPFIENNIRSLPLFNRLLPEQVAVMSEYVTVMRNEAGDVLFRQGEPARGMYHFVSGSAQLIQTAGDGVERQIGIIGANQYLNDAALIRIMNEAATLRVLETSIVLFIARERLIQAVIEHPELRPNLPANLVPPAAPISSVAAAPDAKTRLFREQRENENILLDTRRHVWAYVGRVWLPGVVAFISLIVAFLMPSVLAGLTVFGLGLIIPGLLMLYFYFEWRNDHVIITDQRVIRIERTIPTFQTVVSEVAIGSIQEVKTDIVTSDPASRFLDFGTVTLKTAGDAGNLKLTMIPAPQKIQKLIFDNRELYQQKVSLQQRSVIRSEVDRIVGGDTPGASQKPAGQPDQVVYRKHILYRVQLSLWPALLILFAVGLIIVSTISPSLGNTPLLPVIGFGLILVGGAWLYWTDWDWRHDMYIVGNDTIQLIHRRPLWLQNESDQLSLSKVDSVVSDQNGLLQSIFDFGNVKISLVGGDPGSEKVFRSVGEPQEVQAEIARRQQQLRTRNAAEAERRRRSEIAEYLSVYHESVSGAPPDQAQAPQIPAANEPPSAPPQARRILPAQPNTEQPIPQVRDRTRPPNVPRAKSDNK
ncbi:MAG: cyclic nucleotide-binding domain-containing protein [Chitinophagaceae bacterium]|nr:cyclic nucleotide-binding domain-containing protein [Anaerolineae bacterium]